MDSNLNVGQARESDRIKINKVASSGRNMSDGSIIPSLNVLPPSPSPIRSSSMTITSSSKTTTMSSTAHLTTGGHLEEESQEIPHPLRRSSSWKKFKNTVKETVTGMLTVASGTAGSKVEPAPLMCENLTTDIEQKLTLNVNQLQSRDKVQVCMKKPENSPNPSIVPIPTAITCPVDENMAGSPVERLERQVDMTFPSVREMSNPIEALERQADAAFAAAAKLNSTPFQQPIDFKPGPERIPQIVVTPEERGRVKPTIVPSANSATNKLAQPLMVIKSSSASDISDQLIDEEMKKRQKMAAAAQIKAAITAAAQQTKRDSLDPVEGVKPRRLSDVGAAGPRKTSLNSDEGSPRRLSADVGIGKPAVTVGRSGSFKNKKKPMIWEHFDAVPHNAHQGRCKACHMIISCKYNTGQFSRHLQLAHMDIFRKHEAKIQSEWAKSVVERNITKTN